MLDTETESPGYSHEWPTAMIEELRRLAEVEGLSARGIGQKLKATRAAVIGQCWRRGIKLKGDKDGRSHARRRPYDKAGIASAQLRTISTYAAPSLPRRFSWQEPLDGTREHA